MIYYDTIGPDGYRKPSLYPGKEIDEGKLPEDMQQDFMKLNYILEGKYSREFLKLCSFYNKRFPSLKYLDWANTSYNVVAFTTINQERSDTGTGVSSNYLKQVIDTICSRLGTVSFHPKLLAEEPTFEYVIYKDEVERMLRKMLWKSQVTRLNLESFHDASILGYAYVFVDPYTGKYRKATDYEVGIYESQLNEGEIKQMLFRDYAFPVTSLAPYLVMEDAKSLKRIDEVTRDKSSVDFKLYFDCINHRVHPVINDINLHDLPYPFDTVLVSVFIWDVGFSKVTTTSLFDLLYPIQREINKINAKIQQLIRTYKGPVPVFANDVDLGIKEVNNSSGEIWYVDSNRPVDTMCTVINPTPLDAQLQAEITSRKTEMMELAGIQNISFDAQNLRSAAALVALDQMRDNTFQAQLQGIADFAKDMMHNYVKFMTQIESMPEEVQAVCKGRSLETRDWEAVDRLLTDAQLTLEPVHITDSLNSEYNAPDSKTPDYVQLQTARTVYDIMMGKMTYRDLPYYINNDTVTVMVAVALTKFDALRIEIPDTLHRFLMDAFIDNVKRGKARL